MRHRIGLFVFVVLSGAFGLSHTAIAAPVILTVNTTVDSVDSNLGNGVCADSANRCSLRAAVMEASARDDGSTITVPAGTYLLTLASGVDDQSFGDLDITGELTLQGSNAAKTIIRQTVPNVRVMMVEEATGNVTISGLTLTGGTVNDIVDGNIGGAIRVRSTNTVNLSNLILLSNQALFGGGIGCINSTITLSDSRIEGNLGNYEAGGIYSALCDVTLSRIIVKNNQSYERAGGILSEDNDVFSLSDSVIEGNIAGDLGGGLMVLDSPYTIERTEFMRNNAHEGAGLFVDGAISVGSISQSYFHDNRASGNGGGLHVKDGDLNIDGSSFIQNYAVQGSGAYVGPFLTQFMLQNSTFSGNMSLLRGSLYVDSSVALLNHITISGGSALYEGGLTAYGNPTLNNSIIANSFSPIGFGDCGGDFISSGKNLIENAAGCNSSITGDEITGVDPEFQSVTVNVTIGEVDSAMFIGLPSLMPSSPSLVNDAGLNDCLSTDQHGTARTLTGCDLGAVEIPAGMTSRQIVRNGSFEESLLSNVWKSVSATKFVRACENTLTQKYPAYLGRCALSGNKGAGRYDQKLLAAALPQAGDNVILQAAVRVSSGVPVGTVALLKLTGAIAGETLTLTLMYTPTVGYEVVSGQTCLEFNATKGKLSVYAGAGSKVEVDDVGVFVQTGTSCVAPRDGTVRDGALSLPPVTIPDGFRGGN